MAAAIKVLSSNGVAGILRELGPTFERSSGQRLAIDLDAASILKRKILDGAAFDVAILTAAIADDLIKAGKLVAATRADIARSGVGVAVRAGAPKPDIGTTEAFRRALLDAKSVAYTTQGASGQYFVSLLEKLGIADQVKAKAKTRPSGIIGELLASGEAELAVQQISELMKVSGIELLGPLPPELQSYTTFTAAVSASAKEPAAAKAFIKFLSAPEALPVIKTNGMESPS
ncbi:MAG TPA: substrate-binding domain-containing protein [Stellaceae bacterium]|nr:substrate-binding domain-containing protein [Stellaceae bacterium]